MGKVLELKPRTASDWTSLERGQLLTLAERLPEHLAGDLAFGQTEAGDPWFAVLDGEGDVIVHVARISGFVVVHAVTENVVAEGPDLPAAVSRFFGAVEPGRRIIAAAPLFDQVLPEHMFAAFVQPDLELADPYQDRRAADESGVFVASAPLPTFTALEDAFVLPDDGEAPRWEPLPLQMQAPMADAPAAAASTLLLPSSDATAGFNAPTWFTDTAVAQALPAAQTRFDAMSPANDDGREGSFVFEARPQQDRSGMLQLQLSGSRDGSAASSAQAQSNGAVASNDFGNLAGWQGEQVSTAPNTGVIAFDNSSSDFQIRTISQAPDQALRAAAPQEAEDQIESASEERHEESMDDYLAGLSNRIESLLASLPDLHGSHFDRHDNDAPISLSGKGLHLEAAF